LPVLCALLALGSCVHTPSEVDAAPGALIQAELDSQVGVLLDEIPESARDRIAATLLAKPEEFWVGRAKRQVALASYRLSFRGAYYDEEERKKQLPLPADDVWQISLVAGDDGAVARRTTVDGHDLIVVDFSLHTVILTDRDSPSASEPALAAIGGIWEEPLIFPVDPEQLLQRTGFACMDEGQFPPNSVDSEGAAYFYDQECDVEDELTPDGCHYTVLAEESCTDALTHHVGKIETSVRFERLAWDPQVADQFRVGSVTNLHGSDLDVNRLIYRYIESDSCALVEQCVTGSGWRRLLAFNASERNLGTKAVHIGDIDYFVDDPDDPTPNANHHVFEYSACHNHFHFSHYASFSLGGESDLGAKRAFCVQSVYRYSNNEHSPTWSLYDNCAFQGITEGWGDQYNAGIECQWLDVTSTDTSSGPVTQALGFRSNPDGFLCEGRPELEADGSFTWEPTAFTNARGETVDRPVCDFTENWNNNNYEQREVTLPVVGEGFITQPCEHGQLGPLRNCGWQYSPTLGHCTPGEPVALRCKLDPLSLLQYTSGLATLAPPQVVRVCEGSATLGAGVACFDEDKLGGASLDGDEQLIEFACPDARGENEPGGLYSLYTGALFPEDARVLVTCTPE
jgi:hypothetical protein